MNAEGRTHKAILGAILAYGQYAVALGAVFFITPLSLRLLGPRRYGLWLSSGEVLGYIFLLDFGVFGILPWLIARADGQRDAEGIKRFLVQGFAVALGLVAVFLLAFFGGRSLLPVWLHLSAADWGELKGPLSLLVVLLAVNLPLNIFLTLLGGLQDVRFCGVLGMVKTFAGPLLVGGLLLGGQGLYALAVGTALLAPLTGIAAFFRARRLMPHLLSGWPLPTWAGAARLFRESVGAWLGGAGVQLMERSSAIMLAMAGSPAMVPTLVCTSRVGQMLTQMAWVLPDSALVGLAQLSGEDDPPRLREVTLSIIRLNVLLAGLMACEVLAINPALVRLWVGKQFFGGLLLNALLAAEVLNASLAHGLATTISVQGHRLSIGLATVAQGIVYVVLALVLIHRLSLEGLLLADLAALWCATIPVGLWLLGSKCNVSLAELASALGSLGLRIVPCLLVAASYGYWRMQTASLIELALAGALLGLCYLRLMGPHLVTFPLPEKVKTLLRRFHLIPAAVVGRGKATPPALIDTGTARSVPDRAAEPADP